MKSVEKRIKENMEAGPQRDGLLDMVNSFFDTDDYYERVKISNKLFPFEKKLIPKYEGNCNVLIMSVGMRKEPVILSIISVAPERVFLLHTEGSRPTAEEVMNDPDIISMNVDFELLEIDEVDAANNYHVLKELQQKIEGDILMDPTGGRKIVGTVLGTFAFFYRIP
ncbi:MAG: hypothetical protein E4G94_10345, partial [ANME-2 cluster archaeon]